MPAPPAASASCSRPRSRSSSSVSRHTRSPTPSSRSERSSASSQSPPRGRGMIATGRWMLGHGRVPFSDPFSYTHGGQTWYAHEWLSELVLGIVDRVAGYVGGIILTALLVAVGAWLLARAARYYGSTALGALLLI